MTNKYDKYISLQIRVVWKTSREWAFDDDAMDEVYAAVMKRIENCLATNVCGQVGAIPGTEKMEIVYSISM